MRPPETRFKHALDAGFDTAFACVPHWRTAIAKGLGQKSGIPDRLYIAEGRLVWVEAKVAPNHLSELQRVVLGAMSAAGAHIYVATFHARLMRPGRPLQGDVHVEGLGGEGEVITQWYRDLTAFREQVGWKGMFL